MKKKENTYQCFSVKGVDLYIESGLLAKASENEDQLKVFMGDYGIWTLQFIP